MYFTHNLCFYRCNVTPASMIHAPNPEGDGVDRPSQNAMAEVLGQKSLLGFGVVLAWLVLFHLLVNIWLLCVFTSLLVVLGGWLGSQAVLESNSVVHLERFIKLEQVLYIYYWDCLLQKKKNILCCQVPTSSSLCHLHLLCHC